MLKPLMSVELQMFTISVFKLELEEKVDTLRKDKNFYSYLKKMLQLQ